MTRSPVLFRATKLTIKSICDSLQCPFWWEWWLNRTLLTIEDQLNFKLNAQQFHLIHEDNVCLDKMKVAVLKCKNNAYSQALICG